MAMAMMGHSKPEEMNSTPTHAKVKTKVLLSDPLFVAGTHVTGKMEVECKADHGVGIGILMIELFGVQELTSRDHSATSRFLHARRLFQGPGLPPSNAVHSHPIPGEPPIPADYFPARKGKTSFLFRIPIPISSPSSIAFGGNLACVKYDVRATVGVAYEGERRLVTDKKIVEVVEVLEPDFNRREPEGIVVGENGKIWMQGTVIGGVLVAGETGCVELQVKNHSSRKTTGVQVSVNRSLHLPLQPEASTLQLKDTLTTVSYRGPEYIMSPGAEGVASLVFDIPPNARSVKGGQRFGDNEEQLPKDALFEVRCIVSIKLGMPLSCNDIVLELPVVIMHPLAMPELPDLPIIDQFAIPQYNRQASPTPALPFSPMPPHYQYSSPQVPDFISAPVRAEHRYVTYEPSPLQMWIPSQTITPYQPFSPQHTGQQYAIPAPVTHLGPKAVSRTSVQGHTTPVMEQIYSGGPEDGEEGKGEVASRISRHLRLSSVESRRGRSLSPNSHRYPAPVLPTQPNVSESANQKIQNLQESSTPQSLRRHSTASEHTPIRSAMEDMILSPRPRLSPRLSKSRLANIERWSHTSAIPSPMLSPPLVTDERNLEALSECKLNSSASTTPAEFKSVGIDKTLPTPPVPTRTQDSAAVYHGKAEAVQIFSEPNIDNRAPTAPNIVSSNEEISADGGLEALERRLIIDVGTRKPLQPPRVDIRSLMASTQETEDSQAIKNDPVSLATRKRRTKNLSPSTESKTLIKSTNSPEIIVSVPEIVPSSAEMRMSETPNKDRSSGVDANSRKKEGEIYRMREAAKERVAAWLGNVDEAAEKDLGTKIQPDSYLEQVSSTSTAKLAGAATKSDEASQHAAITVPNHRSSGFLPIGSKFCNESGARWSTMRKTEVPRIVKPLQPTTSPPKPEAKLDGAITNIQTDLLSSLNRFEPNITATAPSRAPVSSISPSITQEHEVKYDIKSARGGKGGRVTAVTAIWASQIAEETENVKSPVKVANKAVGQRHGREPAENASHPQISRDESERNENAHSHKQANSSELGKQEERFEEPLPLRRLTHQPLARRHKESNLGDPTSRTAAFIKSPSSPAVVSASVAKPTLSSTASLARTAPRPGPGVKRPPNVSINLPDISKAIETSVASKDLAFGQARLRDLIKKYQG